MVRREHEPSGRPKSLPLSENRDIIVTTNIYLSFSEETGSSFGSSSVKCNRCYAELLSKLLDHTARLNFIHCYKNLMWEEYLHDKKIRHHLFLLAPLI